MFSVPLVVLGTPLVYRLAKGDVRNQPLVLEPSPVEGGRVVACSKPLLDCLPLKRLTIRGEHGVSHDLVGHGVEKRRRAHRIVT
jgi:hypothetical protein